MSNNIQQAYEQIRKWYSIAGRLNHANHEAALDGVPHQLELIDEELKETFTAFEEQNVAELVDGTCDMFFVVCGEMLRLEAMGVNIEKALARVCENNMTKYPLTHEHKQNPALAPEGCEVVFTDYGHVVYKRPLDGKILKPTNYTPVNLVGTFPEDLFGTSLDDNFFFQVGEDK
jgi:phosphoribosyl-ATP pyrophosphohydrolase